MKVSKDYCIPYLGGYSKDGKTLYIDRYYPQYYKQKDGNMVDAHSFLIEHEKYEANLMSKVKDITFEEAHRAAIRHEKRLLEAAGVDVEEYYKNLYKWVEYAMGHFTKADVPPDLNIRPYTEDKLTSVVKELKGYHEPSPDKSVTKKVLEKNRKKDTNTLLTQKD